MIRNLYMISAIILIFTNSANANETTEETTNLIRKCAPSENLRLKLEGEIGGFIAKKIAGASVSGSGEIFQDGELLSRMIEASPEDAVEIYKMYLDCVKKEVEIFIEARRATNPFNVKPGESFSVKFGTSVNIFNGEYIFSVNGWRPDNSNRPISRVKTTLIGGGRTLYTQHRLGEGARLKTRPCIIVLTGINNETYTFRFVLQCKS